MDPRNQMTPQQTQARNNLSKVQKIRGQLDKLDSESLDFVTNASKISGSAELEQKQNSDSETQSKSNKSLPKTPQTVSNRTSTQSRMQHLQDQLNDVKQVLSTHVTLKAQNSGTSNLTGDKKQQSEIDKIDLEALEKLANQTQAKFQKKPTEHPPETSPSQDTSLSPESPRQPETTSPRSQQGLQPQLSPSEKQPTWVERCCSCLFRSSKITSPETPNANTALLQDKTKLLNRKRT